MTSERRPLWQRRYDRRAAMRYWHAVGVGRPCYKNLRVIFCWSCWWGEVTGKNRRDLAAEIARMKEVRDNWPPKSVGRYRKDSETGRYFRVPDDEGSP